MANKDTAKQWFETGDFPTQSQFAQTFDWLRWNDQTITPDDVTGLIELLQQKADMATIEPLIDAVLREGFSPNTDFVYNLPAHKRLQSVIIIPTADMNLKIGTTAGGDEIMLVANLLQNQPFILDCAVYSVTGISIYFTGISAPTQLFIYKR